METPENKFASPLYSKVQRLLFSFPVLSIFLFRCLFFSFSHPLNSFLLFFFDLFLPPSPLSFPPPPSPPSLHFCLSSYLRSHFYLLPSPLPIHFTILSFTPPPLLPPSLPLLPPFLSSFSLPFSKFFLLPVNYWQKKVKDYYKKNKDKVWKRNGK